MISMYAIVAAAVVALLVIIVSAAIVRRRPGKLNQAKFGQRWHDIQQLCGKPETWPLAVINGDKLVDEALKKCHYRGKTMGERLVAAQRDLSSNDTIWYGHKLRNKLVHEDYQLRSKDDVKDALLGFLQALKDLGAMHQ